MQDYSTSSALAMDILQFWTKPSLYSNLFQWVYHQISNIRRTLVGNIIVDHSDVVRALPVGTAPTTSSFST